MANPPKSAISARNRCLPAELAGDLLELGDVVRKDDHRRPPCLEAPARSPSGRRGRLPPGDRAFAGGGWLRAQQALSARVSRPKGIVWSPDRPLPGRRPRRHLVLDVVGGPDGPGEGRVLPPSKEPWSTGPRTRARPSSEPANWSSATRATWNWSQSEVTASVSW